MRYLSGMPVNGIVLRSPVAGDAADVVALMLKTYAETEFLHSTPEEFTVTEEQEVAWIQRIEMSERDCMIGAWIDGALVGNVSLRAVSDLRRTRHRATLGICVVKEAWGRGVGSMLMDAALQTAESAGFRQVELEVCADNERAIRLYQRFGFGEYGRRPNGMRRDGLNVDEILMVKQLV